ncbi:MAG: AraC family transcriptional regulator [Firmicutes bacterium]|nr:AraC family transcriptional regulator [[Eubacterium] siraeum]MCM1487708.1 AraC family transcriptional regulator [Bacillota bacterium]
MNTLAKMYRPITAAPFQNNRQYCEIPPCEALKPFVRCFWGTKSPVSSRNGSSASQLVIPDTCMDIIFNVSPADNRADSFFCTVDERSYFSGNAAAGPDGSIFAVRFYGWTAVLFTERELGGRKNEAFPAEEFFGDLKSRLEPFLFEHTSLEQRAKFAEKLLLGRLCERRSDSALLNGIYYMLKTDCRAKISEVCGYSCVGEKQLERIFNFNTGVSPKTFSSLLRYQLLWQDMNFSENFSLLDAVEKYGYTDQSHLLRDFKRRHLMTPKEALAYGRKFR